MTDDGTGAVDLPPRARARLEILERFEAFVTGPLVPGAKEFALRYNAGEVMVSEGTRRHCRTVSGSTVMRWRRAYITGGAWVLADRWGAGRSRSRILDRDMEVADAILACIEAYPSASAPAVRGELIARFEARRVPSPRSLARFIAAHFAARGAPRPLIARGLGHRAQPPAAGRR
jgi:hypothetical protein